MLRSVFALVIVAALFFPRPTSAADPEYHTGNFYLKLCKSETRGEKDICLLYVTGVLAQHAFSHCKYFCPPVDVTTGQVIRIVVKHMEENPTETHNLFVQLINEALNKAYPCKTENQK